MSIISVEQSLRGVRMLLPTSNHLDLATRRQAGVALVETAMGLGVTVILFAGILGLGVLLNRQGSVIDAARYAARTAAAAAFDGELACSLPTYSSTCDQVISSFTELAEKGAYEACSYMKSLGYLESDWSVDVAVDADTNRSEGTFVGQFISVTISPSPNEKDMGSLLSLGEVVIDQDVTGNASFLLEGSC